jgi:sirohydrochlorin cobaltochelatase
VSALAQERALGDWLATGLRCIGQIAIECRDDASFALAHRDDATRNDLASYARADDAADLARFDDAGNYRPLKTAPNLRHGWQLSLENLAELRAALDLFYPGRLAAVFAFEKRELTATPLRETLERQSGMYRIASQIDEDQADKLIGDFCRSDGGCLRTILWRRQVGGIVASTRLPAEKFDPRYDQTGSGGQIIPLLCQEACGLLIAAAREVVQAGRDVSRKRR